MGPNQTINMSGTGATGAVPVQSTPAASPENIMAQGVSEKKKGGKGMLYGMILCAVLAVGGIGFGVWTWMDGNTQKDSLNQQISDLKKQNSELMNQLDNNVDIEVDGYKNPIISASSPKAYRVFYSLPVYDNHTNNNKNMIVTISDGEYLSCAITGENGECSITGLPSGIYKEVLIYEGNGNGNEKIGFLMEDGSIWYVEVYDSDFNINKNMEAKRLNIEGFVKDVVSVTYTEDVNNPAGGYGSTVFVMGDGSFVKYDESMLN